MDFERRKDEEPNSNLDHNRSFWVCCCCVGNSDSRHLEEERRTTCHHVSVESREILKFLSSRVVFPLVVHSCICVFTNTCRVPCRFVSQTHKDQTDPDLIATNLYYPLIRPRDELLNFKPQSFAGGVSGWTSNSFSQRKRQNKAHTST